MDRRRVRFLIHGAERSGPPIHVLRLCRHWHRSDPGFDVEVVTARPGELQEELASVAVLRVARLDRRSPESLAARALSAAGAPGSARHLLRRATAARASGIAADITVVNGATAPTAALLRYTAPEGPVVMIAHELSTGWFGNITAEDRALFLDRCSSFAAVSEAVRDYLVELGIPEEQITVIPPAVEMPRTRRPTAASGHGTVTVVGAGETDWRKAPDLWLQVAAAAVAQAPELDLRFRWFGGAVPSSPEGWPIRHEITHLGLEGRVEFLGRREDPWASVGKADVFLSTAREDAAPLACAEAVARGMPVVSFDSGGTAELVRDGCCGQVVPYPRVDAAATAVVALARDAELRRRWSENGAAFVEQHRSVSVVADQTSAWLRGILDRGAAAPAARTDP